MNVLEPDYLDRLPPRFRQRRRENLIVLVFVIMLVVIPPRAGSAGTLVFFTMIWLANSLYYGSRLRSLKSNAPRPAVYLFWLMTALLGYPIVAGWFARPFDGIGFLALALGWIAWLSLAIIYRKIAFPEMFGSERSNLWIDLRVIRQARRESRADQASLIDSFKNRPRR